jgi:hypothetical protein
MVAALRSFTPYIVGLALLAEVGTSVAGMGAAMAGTERG